MLRLWRRRCISHGCLKRRKLESHWVLLDPGSVKVKEIQQHGLNFVPGSVAVIVGELSPQPYPTLALA